MSEKLSDCPLLASPRQLTTCPSSSPCKDMILHTADDPFSLHPPSLPPLEKLDNVSNNESSGSQLHTPIILTSWSMTEEEFCDLGSDLSFDTERKSVFEFDSCVSNSESSYHFHCDVHLEDVNEKDNDNYQQFPTHVSESESVKASYTAIPGQQSCDYPLCQLSDFTSSYQFTMASSTHSSEHLFGLTEAPQCPFGSSSLSSAYSMRPVETLEPENLDESKTQNGFSSEYSLMSKNSSKHTSLVASYLTCKRDTQQNEVNTNEDFDQTNHISANKIHLFSQAEQDRERTQRPEMTCENESTTIKSFLDVSKAIGYFDHKVVEEDKPISSPEAYHALPLYGKDRKNNLNCCSTDGDKSSSPEKGMCEVSSTMDDPESLTIKEHELISLNSANYLEGTTNKISKVTTEKRSIGTQSLSDVESANDTWVSRSTGDCMIKITKRKRSYSGSLGDLPSEGCAITFSKRKRPYSDSFRDLPKRDSTITFSQRVSGTLWAPHLPEDHDGSEERINEDCDRESELESPHEVSNIQTREDETPTCFPNEKEHTACQKQKNRKKIVCCKCHDTFLKKATLLRHSTLKAYCGVCNTSLESICDIRSHFESHMRFNLDNYLVYECKVCAKQFLSFSQLERHNRSKASMEKKKLPVTRSAHSSQTVCSGKVLMLNSAEAVINRLTPKITVLGYIGIGACPDHQEKEECEKDQQRIVDPNRNIVDSSFIGQERNSHSGKRSVQVPVSSSNNHHNREIQVPVSSSNNHHNREIQVPVSSSNNHHNREIQVPVSSSNDHHNREIQVPVSSSNNHHNREIQSQYSTDRQQMSLPHWPFIPSALSSTTSLRSELSSYIPNSFPLPSSVSGPSSLTSPTYRLPCYPQQSYPSQSGNTAGIEMNGLALERSRYGGVLLPNNGSQDPTVFQSRSVGDFIPVRDAGHYSRPRSTETLYRCPKCAVVLNSEELFAAHQHRGLVECALCPAVFTSACDRVLHVKSHFSKLPVY